jgi:hypothetical protein
VAEVRQSSGGGQIRLHQFRQHNVGGAAAQRRRA